MPPWRQPTSSSSAPSPRPAPPPSTTRSCRSSLPRAGLVEAYGRGGFMGQVHTDPAVRDAGNEAEERINKWRVAVAFRDRPVSRRSRIRRYRRGEGPRGRAGPAARALAARLPPRRPRAERRGSRRAGAAPNAARRGGGRLPAQHQRVSRRHRRDPRAAGGPARRLHRAPLARGAGGDVSGQPGLPGGEPVPRAGERPRPAPRAVHQELEQGRCREPAAAGGGAGAAQAGCRAAR